MHNKHVPSFRIVYGTFIATSQIYSFNSSGNVTCGCDSISRLQEHILPSVETLIRLLAFWVPTTFTQYTGCCKDNEGDISLVLNTNQTEPTGVHSTVCAAADSGVLCTGVLLLLLLSHRTICPEYVPPTTMFGWNFANDVDITADCKNGGSVRRRHHI